MTRSFATSSILVASLQLAHLTFVYKVMSMEARDAIVSWLEQSDNFVRATAASPFSPRLGRGALQVEARALHELAAFVNETLPQVHWDARHAKQMLKHYLMEYRSTAQAAGNPGFSLDDKDALRGLKTVQDKLESMCRHFARLHTLHEAPEDKEIRSTYVKLRFPLTDAQRAKRELGVVPETDLSNNSDEKAGSCDQMEMERREQEVHNVFEIMSNEEEQDEGPPATRKSTRAKRRASVTLNSKDESRDSRVKKMRRVISEQVSEITSTQTTQTADSSGSNDGDSQQNDENAPSLKTRSYDRPSPGKTKRSVRKVPPAPPVVSSSTVDRPETSLPKANLTEAAAAPSSPVRSLSANHVPNRKSTQATVHESLRLAIAEVVSQRQQLLDSHRYDPESQDSLDPQKNQLSQRDSEIALNSVEVPSVDPKSSASSNGKRSFNGRRLESGAPEGLLPPLIDLSFTGNGKANLKRKRMFLSAKQLAFEQLKWQCENELQKRELELLHHEMEVREALAQQELKLQRMRIRADIIQLMICAGASIADIVERLSLL